jgi:hypothetical protein
MQLAKRSRLACSLACAILLALILLQLRSSGPALAEEEPGILFVRPNGSGDACTQDAPCALQTALANAHDADAIWLAAGVMARMRLPGIGASLGQQYDALVHDLGLLGAFLPSLTGVLIKITTAAGIACLALAVLFSLLLFACGRLLSGWVSLTRRVEGQEQLTAEIAERAERQNLEAEHAP